MSRSLSWMLAIRRLRSCRRARCKPAPTSAPPGMAGPGPPRAGHPPRLLFTASTVWATRLRPPRVWRPVPAGGRPPAPLSVHGIRSWDRPSPGDGRHLGSRHRISTAFQHAGQDRDHGPLQALIGRHGNAPSRSLASIPHQLVERDRQIAHALAGRVIDRVRNRRRSADNADFADALDAERIDLVILLFDENYVDRMHIRIYRHMIVGKVGGHESPEPVIGRHLFMQRHPDTADHSAENLAARDFRIKDATGRHSAEHSRGANDTHLLVDTDTRVARRVR